MAALTSRQSEQAKEGDAGGELEGASEAENLAHSEASWWTELGGDDLEEPLKEGWVQLVRASWLVELSTRGGVLCRRQDLPQEALIGLEELKAKGPISTYRNKDTLRIIVVSYPWLQPDHPDPHGESLRVIATALRACIWGDGYPRPTCAKLYAVLIDFTALFQAERTDEEKRLFELALPSLNLFYAHPRTVVLKLPLPPGYPDQGAHRYVLPDGANTVAYADRGWCFAESAMSGLVKPSSKSLDLGLLSADLLEADVPRFPEVADQCKAGRAPPWHPEDFRAELDKKTFTSKRADFDKVAQLYADAFARHLGSARQLQFWGLGWGAEEARRLARALPGNNGTLQVLELGQNRLGLEGVLALAEVPCVKSGLRTLGLGENNIGPEGASALAEALLRGNSASLRELILLGNSIGSEGAAALAGALRANASLVELNLWGNSIGSKGAAALAGALRANASLGKLDLSVNHIGWEGAAALAEALRVNTSLDNLVLSSNNIGSHGAATLAAALQVNASLDDLRLACCGIGSEGAVALAAALRVSTSLRRLDLMSNAIGAEGAAALAEAFRVNNGRLGILGVSRDEIGEQGVAALEDAARVSGTDIEWY